MASRIWDKDIAFGFEGGDDVGLHVEAIKCL